jgi:hypothetical protein
MKLTDDQIAFYRREGYLTLPAITTPEEIGWMIGVYDRLFAERAGRENGDQYDLGGTDEEGKPALLPQIAEPSRYAPELKESLFHRNTLEVAKQLLGAEVHRYAEHMIYKPPLVGAPTPWHQDEAYSMGDYEYRSLQFWMPLQPATLENGCMLFIPRSHLREVQPHHSIGHDPRVHGLEVDYVDASNAVACPLEAGGCTIHHVRMFHYAGPNRTTMPRRAYILGYAMPLKKRAVPNDHYWNRNKQTARDQRAKAAAEKK